MKILLWMSFVLFAVNVSPKDEPRSYTLNDFNKMRAKMAGRFKIADMNELSWNADLITKAEGLSCKDTHGSDYRVFLSPDVNDVLVNTAFEELDDKFLQEMMDSNNLYFFEMLLPKQKLIGCASKRCEAMTPVSSNMRSNLLFMDICVMGPSGNIEKPIMGEPGSKCESEQHMDGLCVHYEPLNLDSNAPQDIAPGDSGDASDKSRSIEKQSIRPVGTPPPGPNDPPKDTSSTPTSSSSSFSFVIIPLIVSLVLIA